MKELVMILTYKPATKHSPLVLRLKKQKMKLKSEIYMCVCACMYTYLYLYIKMDASLLIILLFHWFLLRYKRLGQVKLKSFDSDSNLSFSPVNKYFFCHLSATPLWVSSFRDCLIKNIPWFMEHEGAQNSLSCTSQLVCHNWQWLKKS